jgi:hypothetical protein
MKRFCLYFVTAVLAFTVGVLVSLTNRSQSTVSQTLEIEALPLDSPCLRDAFTVKDQPGAAARLRIVSASCNGSSSSARLTLQNRSPKDLRGYAVGNIEDYEYKRNVESSQGVSTSAGVVLASGASTTLNFGGGFVNGLSYCKPVGSIQRNFFWIKRLDYTDGTSWQDSDPKR